VLLANIGVLTASSFVLTIGHSTRSWHAYFLTFLLGIIFLANQVDELFSLLALNATDDLGLTLFCLYIHLSHLTLSLVLFVKILISSSHLLGDSALPFVSAYWHLVELVWILILATLVGV
jgi:cytochrome c oxidase subunit 3